MHGLQEIEKRFVLCFTTEVISFILEEAEAVHVLWSSKFIEFLAIYLYSTQILKTGIQLESSGRRTQMVSFSV